ncbi:hypothetical protein [Candidatus Electronema sp. PJ]
MKELCYDAREEYRSLAKKFSSAKEEFYRLAKELYSAEKEFGLAKLLSC